eukprot:Blabericola_migrator_1__3563@NODE_2058_length_3348_cov_196_088692_g1114_i1_p2_GENE_NODE_2058_length_3348_cov_196_088692_g1114_i1NODE_2058_length_3348_cov_196_088692_g1114_i1_p2_ORF_typecomplete_len100_score18_45_NODE_2058_length_3348_cov_196_088692_g1114_i113901689
MQIGLYLSQKIKPLTSLYMNEHLTVGLALLVFSVDHTFESLSQNRLVELQLASAKQIILLLVFIVQEYNHLWLSVVSEAQNFIILSFRAGVDFGGSFFF